MSRHFGIFALILFHTNALFGTMAVIFLSVILMYIPKIDPWACQQTSIYITSTHVVWKWALFCHFLWWSNPFLYSQMKGFLVMTFLSFHFSCPLHLYLIFSVDMGQYSRPLHMHTHVPSHTCTAASPELSGSLWMHRGGRGRDTHPKRGHWDMQMQTCFPTGA